MQKGGKVQTLDAKLKDLTKELAKTRMQLDLKKQTIAEDEKRVVELEAAVKEVRKMQIFTNLARNLADTGLFYSSRHRRKRRRRH